MKRGKNVEQSDAPKWSGNSGDNNRPSEVAITINVNGVPVTPIQRVFLQRDYREGVAIRFMTDFPPELTGRVRRILYSVNCQVILMEWM